MSPHPPLKNGKRWLPSSPLRALSPSRQQVLPALVTHPKRGLVERHRFDRITVAVVPLGRWTVLHAVVAVSYVLEEVNLHEMACAFNISNST